MPRSFQCCMGCNQSGENCKKMLGCQLLFLCIKKGSPAQGEAILAQAGTSAVGCFGRNGKKQKEGLLCTNRIVSKGSRQQSDAHRSVGSYGRSRPRHSHCPCGDCDWPWRRKGTGGRRLRRRLFQPSSLSSRFRRILGEKMGFTPAGEKPPPLTEAKGTSPAPVEQSAYEGPGVSHSHVEVPYVLKLLDMLAWLLFSLSSSCLAW